VVHGSSANTSTDTARRAFSSRWAGVGVRLQERWATMPLLWEHGLLEGEELAGPLFPRVLPSPIAAEGERRARGPEPPDAARVQRVLSAIARRTER